MERWGELGAVNKEHIELFFRPTVFSQTILAEIWDALSLLERINLLLCLRGSSGLMVKELRIKTLKDPSPVVRMLAVKCTYISEDDEPELYAGLKADPSALVRAAVTQQHISYFITAENLGPLSHIERLGLIALSDSLNEEDFAQFIVDGLRNQTLPEEEAAELVCEFVRNPNLSAGFDREPADGLDWYSMQKDFEAIWDLTTCTPPRVHQAIAWEYPLEVCDNSISDEMLNRMNESVIEALVWCRYRPLLKLLESTPERFSDKIKKAAQQSANKNKIKKNAHSELDILREELNKLRAEMGERLDTLFRQIERG